ncbi:MAG: methyltransferase domain-containing protein, partial [bacterium]|nr:methyltransferase domain-containing protein [bacterium]
MTESAQTQYLAHHLRHIHATSAKEHARYDRYFEKNLLRHLPAQRAARILDVGCGTGHFLHFLKQAGYANYAALDCCGDALDLCVAHGLIGREQCHAEDAVTFFNRPQEPWDAVVMNDVIEHIEKAQIIGLLSAIRRALRPGGVLLVKTVNA